MKKSIDNILKRVSKLPEFLQEIFVEDCCEAVKNRLVVLEKVNS